MDSQRILAQLFGRPRVLIGMLHLAGWIATGQIEGALERGVISAGLALEGVGAQGFMGVNPEMAERRRRERFPAHGLP